MCHYLKQTGVPKVLQTVSGEAQKMEVKKCYIIKSRRAYIYIYIHTNDPTGVEYNEAGKLKWFPSVHAVLGCC